jgi:hypothetical protein
LSASLDLTMFVKFNVSVSLYTHLKPTKFEYSGIVRTIFCSPWFCVKFSVFSGFWFRTSKWKWMDKS